MPSATSWRRAAWPRRPASRWCRAAPRSTSALEAVKFADGIGYPVVTKASAGGGGRGMVVARDAKALATGFERASVEAKEAFGDGTLYVERYVEHARHIEVQAMGGGDGRVARLRRARLLAAAPLSEDGRGGAGRDPVRGDAHPAAQRGDRPARLDPTIATPARSNSSTTWIATTSISWRSTPASRSSTLCPK